MPTLESFQRVFQQELFGQQVAHLVQVGIGPDDVAGAEVKTGVNDGLSYEVDYVTLGQRELPTEPVVIMVGNQAYPTPLFNLAQVGNGLGGQRELRLIRPVDKPRGELKGKALEPVRELFRPGANGASRAA